MLRGFCAAALALMMIAPAPVHANKPLIGVACGGGFYVRAPTQKIYWIHGDPLEKTVAYDGADKLMALAECGTGTVAVLGSADQSQVFFSGDCLNLGAASGQTRLIHQASEPVTGLTVDEGRLTITLASGSVHDAAICQPTDGAAN